MTRKLLETLASLHIGTLVGDRYELLRLVGCGGSGAVFEARHRFTRGIVAIKLLLAAEADSVAGRRFQREARVLTRLSHPHIVRVFDMGDDHGTLYLAEEFIAGESLREHLRAHGPLGPHDARALVLSLLDALAYTHGESVVHRDVKPENVMLVRAPDGAIKPVLIDFGIARVDEPDEARSRTGTVLGTPAYMAPEQCLAAASVDARCDVWAVGSVLFELLAGRPPFDGSPTEVLASLLTLDPPPLCALAPEAPPSLVEVISQALRRAPEARYPSARAFADALQACGTLPTRPLALTTAAAANATLPETGAAPPSLPLPASVVHAVPDAASGAPTRSRGLRVGLVALLACTLTVVALQGIADRRPAPRPVAQPSPTRPTATLAREPSPPVVAAPPPVNRLVAPATTVAPTAPVRGEAPIARRGHAREAPPRSVEAPSPPHPSESRGANGAPIFEP